MPFLDDITKTGQSIGQGLVDILGAVTSPVVPILEKVIQLNNYLDPRYQQNLIQTQRLLQQQAQQQFYREQAEKSGQRAEEGLQLARERQRLSKEAAARLNEEQKYKQSLRPQMEERQALDLALRKQTLARKPDVKLNIYDQAYNEILQENPRLRDDPHAFGLALASKLPKLTEDQLTRLIDGFQSRGKLLQPTDWWEQTKKSIKTFFKSQPPSEPHLSVGGAQIKRYNPATGKVE